MEGETPRQRSDALLEWLCLHLEEKELPKGFDPRGGNLDVIRPGQDFGATRADAQGAEARGVSATAQRGGGGGWGGEGGGGGGAESVDSVEARLLRYGFGHSEVARAISATGGTGKGGEVGEGGDAQDSGTLDAQMLRPLEVIAAGVASAIESQRKRGGGFSGGVVPAEVQTEEEGRESTEEEVMSLEAIYEGAVTIAPDMPEVIREVP